MTGDTNPLLGEWTDHYGLPPFTDIRPEHFESAFATAMAEHRAEIDAIAATAAAPTFENTIETLERAGRKLRRVSTTFFNLTGAHTNEKLQKIERQVAPQLARHSSEISLNETLFARIDELMARRGELGLGAEQDRVLERYHTRFVRAGARLTGEARGRIGEIMQRLSVLGTTFSHNVLADEKAYELVLDSEDDLAGMPDFLRAAAAQAAEDRGQPGKFVITLSRSIIEPFLQFAARRDLREQAYRAWTGRGDAEGASDNRPIVAETVALRAERARLLGYESFAAFKLDDQMAKTPQAVRDLLQQVWQPAVLRATDEAAVLQGAAQAEGSNAALAPWDWRYYAEKVRQRDHDLDEAEIKPYLQLERIIEAAFDTASQLFGLRFKELHDLPVYHPDLRAFEVGKADGSHLGIFLGDYFARSSKRSGAWKSSFREQEKLSGDIRPIIVNVMNFAKAPKGQPTLLTFDDARTLFHEFGHALHGLMSDLIYPCISGTSVARDFVELPSQLFEHWLSQPEVLKRFARHAVTGEPMPDSLLQRLLAAKNFNQGFSTVEYTASALIDLEIHQTSDAEDLDASAFERELLERIGMPSAILPRHRLPHFAHAFAGDGYSAGYYSYLWSEVMDADVFRAFEEAGDIFDADTASRLAEHIYSAGGRQEPADAYVAFRGRLPTIDALLSKRGLKAA